MLVQNVPLKISSTSQRFMDFFKSVNGDCYVLNRPSAKCKAPLLLSELAAMCVRVINIAVNDVLQFASATYRRWVGCVLHRSTKPSDPPYIVIILLLSFQY